MTRRFQLVAVLGLSLCAATASAEEPRPVYPDFTFKRIGAKPVAGTKRITVQIDPVEQALMLASTMARPEKPMPQVDPDAIAGLPTGPMEYDWYWDAVSPLLGAQGGRFDLAIVALSNAPDGKTVPAPRMQNLQDIAAKHGSDILSATIGTDVSPALVLAVIGIESAGRSQAVSSAGAVGLMQLIPATAERFGVTDSTDPAQNIKGGVAYLDWLMDEFDNDPLMVLAAYNAGEGAVKKNGGVPPYAETRAYVPKVLAAWAVARGLCLTPPQLVSDGCVFAVRG